MTQPCVHCTQTAAAHSLGCNKVCQHRANTSQGKRSEGERPGHGTPLSPRALGAASRGWAQPAGSGCAVLPVEQAAVKRSPVAGYLDTVLQAVAHRRADLLVVAEQSG